jgi:sugar O-acyltransferase (sialic acid O-acetyltransferase NeuD family)
MNSNIGTTMRKPLLVLGARQYAPVFADVFDEVVEHEIVGFVENLDRSVCATPILDRPVYWIDEIEAFAGTHLLICCLATPRRSQFIEQAIALRFAFATLIHPRAWVSGRATIDAGTSLDVSAVVAPFARIGRHVRVGRGATIGHHTAIGEFSTLHPGSDVAGNCIIESKVTIGIGATVINGCRIGAASSVAAGAVVTKDVPPAALVAGTPARIVREMYEAP